MNIYKKLAGATLLAMGLIAFQGVFATSGTVTDEREIIALNYLAVGSGTQTGGTVTPSTGGYDERTVAFNITNITNNSPAGWTITATGTNGLFKQCASSPCATTPVFSGTVATGDAFEYTLVCVGSTVTDTGGGAATATSASNIGTTATTMLSYLSGDGHTGLATANKTSACSMVTAAALLQPVEAGDYQETLTFTIANGP